MADPHYDGLCGIPNRMPLRDGRYLRCQYDAFHEGDHSWKKHEGKIGLTISGGITVDECIRRAATMDSPAAQAMVNALAQRLKD